MSAETLNNTLEEFVRRCPYNSASALIEFNTNSFREQMGGSCAQQLRILDRKLREQGAETKFLKARTSVHTVGIVTAADGERFLIDPSKCMKEALSLDRLFSDREALTSPAFPQNERARRSVRLIPTGEQTFRQEVVTASVKSQWQDDIRWESFDLRDVSDDPPMGEIDCKVSLSGRSIQMVAILPDGDVATLKADDSSRINMRLLAGEEERDPDRRKAIFQAVAETCGATRNELFRYLYQGQLLLQQMLKNSAA